VYVHVCFFSFLPLYFVRLVDAGFSCLERFRQDAHLLLDSRRLHQYLASLAPLTRIAVEPHEHAEPCKRIFVRREDTE
jgi:hypothetical protein